MARITFEDEMQTRGELGLDDVKAGDVIRFEADFEKRADDDEADSATVSADALGEVVDVFDNAGELLVRAPCMRRAPGQMATSQADVLVRPGDDEVILLVHSADPRLGSHRI